MVIITQPCYFTNLQMYVYNQTLTVAHTFTVDAIETHGAI